MSVLQAGTALRHGPARAVVVSGAAVGRAGPDAAGDVESVEKQCVTVVTHARRIGCDVSELARHVWKKVVRSQRRADAIGNDLLRW